MKVFNALKDFKMDLLRNERHRVAKAEEKCRRRISVRETEQCLVNRLEKIVKFSEYNTLMERRCTPTQCIENEPLHCNSQPYQYFIAHQEAKRTVNALTTPA